MAKKVPGYLPQEVYEAGDFIVGEEVIFFDKIEEGKKKMCMNGQGRKVIS
jgi:hypothetical protein